MSLQVKQLTGGYQNKVIVENVSFQLEKGTVSALIGLNGAGKSTILKHILGLLTPKNGEIFLDNFSFVDNPIDYRKRIAYIPETPILYPQLTLEEHLKLTIAAYDLPQETTWQKVNQLLELFRLSDRLKWFPTEFSKGMQQKVMIVNAFITDADLFIIDEPFLGLDPLAVADLIDLFNEQKKIGKTLLLSTHQLTVAEQIVDQFLLIQDGRLDFSGSPKEIRQHFPGIGSLDEIYLKLAGRK